MSSEHDALFRRTFAQPDYAAGEFRAILPPSLVGRLDWPRLRTCPGTFVDEHLATRHTDLLFAVPLLGDETRDAYVYVLFEHQGRSDEHMAYRLLRYMVRIWDAFLGDDPAGKRLPPIVPVVLYQGDGAKPWSAATSFHELVEFSDDGLAALRDLVPSFRYIVDDLTQIDDDGLRARAMAAMARIVLWALKHARDSAEDLALPWRDVFLEARREAGDDALALIWRYILVVNERVSAEELGRAFVDTLGEEVETSMATAGQKLIEEGIARGKVLGRHEGRAEAVVEILVARGIAVSAAERAKVLETKDPSVLRRWLLRASTAASFEELVRDA